MTLAFILIISGIALIWVSAEKLEKRSVLTAKQFGMSPFLIGSTVIAFGTSAPEMLTTFFVLAQMAWETRTYPAEYTMLGMWHNVKRPRQHVPKGCHARVGALYGYVKHARR